MIGRALAIVALLGGAAAADPLRVVVRHGGGDDLVRTRLAGQVSDLDVDVVAAEGALEPTLDAQIARAGALADADGARVVVWFRAQGSAIGRRR